MEVGINPTEGLFSIDVCWELFCFHEKCYSFSIEKFMLKFLDDKYFSTLFESSGEETVQICHQHSDYRAQL